MQCYLPIKFDSVSHESVLGEQWIRQQRLYRRKSALTSGSVAIVKGHYVH